MKRGKIVGNLVVVAFFLFFLLDSLKLHEVRRFGEMGSGFWPILVLFLATLLSGILLISSLRETKRNKGGKEPEAAPSLEEAAARKDQKKVVVLAAAVTAAYIVAMQWIGFALATCLFVLCFVLVLGERRKWVLIISPVLVTALILAIFSRFIEIPFPRGIGAFAELSRFFY
jgi:putative tricarboxylic transport membrane protein